MRALIQPNWPAPLNVKALQTTRQGLDSESGQSVAPYASFNVAMHVGDQPDAVTKNRQLLNTLLPSSPVWVNQVHGMHAIDAAKSTCLENADAAFTHQKNVVCVTMTADCLPILLCDQHGTVVAAVHAGWRGLCDGVIENAIKKMQVPNHTILAWLGPAIGPQAFEVGHEVRAAFLLKDENAHLAFTSKADGKWLCNLYAIAKQRLNAVGVQQIYGATINEDFCTYTDEERFFSFRRNQITGRMASLIWLA